MKIYIYTNNKYLKLNELYSIDMVDNDKTYLFARLGYFVAWVDYHDCYQSLTDLGKEIYNLANQGLNESQRRELVKSRLIKNE